MRSSKQSFESRIAVIALAAAAFVPVVATSQVVAPVPIEAEQPELPPGRSGMAPEGWVVVRYSVLADGTTANVRVIDQMPATLVDRPIRVGVERWRFEPATTGGDAVDWHNNEAVIVFDQQMVPPEPRPPFVAGYREVETLLQEGENEDALRRSRRLVDTEASRLAELGVALVQNARVNMLLGNQHEAYAAIRRATNPGIALLEPSELVVALEYRNTLELGLGDVVGALETFARRQELGAVAENDRMARSVDAIESGLASEAAIAVKGKMLDDAWSHTLYRRTFAIGDLEGDLRQVNVECDRRTAELEYSETAEWSLPESWGACTIFVTGRPDTEFALYEFP
ncbi:MAG TPA: TonB family protein [Gammaproteobacteria bacterium]|jgi:TonB family protein